MPLRGLMEEAVTSLAETLLLPTPRNESQLADILANQMWMQTVFTRTTSPMCDPSIHAEAHPSTRTFTSTESSANRDDTSDYIDTSDYEYVW